VPSEDTPPSLTGTGDTSSGVSAASPVNRLFTNCPARFMGMAVP
jgi:hypothetical protein